MDVAALIDELGRGGRALVSALGGLSAGQAAWKPDSTSWSALEVAAHLLDEERKDFRVRLALVLEDPGKPWPPIDPEGWVREHDYASWSLEETVTAFADERASSIDWLSGLGEVDWERRRDHPQLGPLAAGDLLVAWVAHDALHLRQLARLHHGRVSEAGRPFSSSYAGPW